VHCTPDAATALPIEHKFDSFGSANSAKDSRGVSDS
jgi:hypothetical protein